MRPLRFLTFILLGGVFMHTASAKLVTQTVDYDEDGIPFKGYLTYDDAKTKSGKVPGVLVIPEWWGLTDFAKQRADALAALGYVAFAADMYGYGEVTVKKERASQLASQFYGKALFAQRSKLALEQLIKTDRVNPAKIAVVGFCFGGSAAQSLAYTGAPVAGIVSFHGNPVPAPASAAGKVKAKFLLLNGGDDPNVTPEAKANLEQSLRAAKIEFRSIDYPGAKHAFTNPDADRLAADNGMTAAVGYNEEAAKKSWAEMQKFLRDLFGR